MHLLWIIGDGALFFFLLMNWQAMCTPDEDGLCEPRNWWYNLSIQVRPQRRHTTALLHLPLRTPRRLPISKTKIDYCASTSCRCSTCSSPTACS